MPRARHAFIFVIFLMLSTGFWAGCVSYAPVDEYNLARAAYVAARDADSLRFAPALWFSAEQSYREGQRAFKDRRYTDAKEAFEKARYYAEQAENAARLARMQSGEVLP